MSLAPSGLMTKSIGLHDKSYGTLHTTTGKHQACNAKEEYDTVVIAQHPYTIQFYAI